MNSSLRPKNSKSLKKSTPNKTSAAASSRKRVRRSLQDSRQQILEASLAIINKSGWSGLSLPAVAKKCQISSANVLYHFKSREGLLMALLELITLNNHRIVEEALKPEFNALTRLVVHFERNLEWARKFPEEAQVLIQIYGEAAHNKDFAEGFHSMILRAQKQIYEHLVAGIRESIFPESMAAATVAKYLHNTLVGAFISVAGSRLEREITYPENEIFEFLCTLTQARRS